MTKHCLARKNTFPEAGRNFSQSGSESYAKPVPALQKSTWCYTCYTRYTKNQAPTPFKEERRTKNKGEGVKGNKLLF
jgi:hypothetical protein